MSAKDDGGPAFPVPEMHFAPNTKQACESQGMSLRDWFAGMALQGMLSNSGNAALTNHGGSTMTEIFARWSYEYADAMLAARKAEP